MSRNNRNEQNQGALLRAKEMASRMDRLQPVCDFEQQVKVCMDLLQQQLIKPPIIFGLELETVENKIAGRPTVIVVTDMTTDCPIFGALPNRFWMEVPGLFVNPDKHNWRNQECEIFSRYMHLQPAFREAKKRIYEMRIQAAQTAQAAQATVLEKLRTAQPSHKADATLDENILEATMGNRIFQDQTGAFLRLYYAPQRDEVRIKAISCPAGHELEEVVEAQVYVKQRDLVANLGEDDTPLEGVAALSRQLREYIRNALRAIGKYAPLPEVAAKTVESSVVSQDTTSTDSATTSTVKADLAEILGNGVSELPGNGGRSVPAKRARNRGGNAQMTH